MATNLPIGHPMARKLYSVAAFAATQRKPSFRTNLTGPAPKQRGAEAKLKGQTSPGMPFVRITDLARTKGERVTVDLFDIVTGKPVMGDRKISGKMMTLDFSTQDIRIDQARGGVDPGGRMTQQRTLHDLRGIALANLTGWNDRLEDQLCQVHVSGARGYDNARDWAVPLEADPDFAEIVVNSIQPPSNGRRLFGGDATSVTNLANTDYLKLYDMDRLRAIIAEEVFPPQPVMLEGDPQADDLPLHVLYMTSRQWHYLQTNTDATNWRTFLYNAHARSQGFKHPLFLGQPGMWNGILIKQVARAIRFPQGSVVSERDASGTPQNQTAAVDTDRAIMLGAQALGMAYGRHAKSDYHYSWHEEEQDHGNTVEISTASMGGKAKLRFELINPDGSKSFVDHGVYTLDTYAPAVT